MNQTHAIERAVITHDYDFLSALDFGAPEIQTPGVLGMPALYLAAVRNDLEAARILAEEKGAPVDQRVGCNNTALHAAAAMGYTEMVKLLLANGADLFAQDNWRRTAYNHAIDRGHPDTAEFLRRQDYTTQPQCH